MVDLGIANTRMKDFYDLWSLAANIVFERSALSAAVRATLDRRQTSIPTDVPFALSNDFAANPDKTQQWRAFLGRLGADDKLTLMTVVADLRKFLLPVLEDDTGLNSRWDPESRTWIRE